MSTWLIGKALSPFFLLLLLACIRPWTERLRHHMKDGRLKRFLFTEWR